MNIAIINDSPAAINALETIIGRDSQYRIVWKTGDADAALDMARQRRPDIIMMDTLLPHCDGVRATKMLMEQGQYTIVIAVEEVDNNAGLVFEAMRWGAVDAMVIPAVDDTDACTKFLRKLSMVGTLVESPIGHLVEESIAISACPIVAIGSSSGGPSALVTLLKGLSRPIPACVVIAQHLDNQLLPTMLSWLSDETGIEIHAATKCRPEPDRVYMIDSQKDMVLDSDGIFRMVPPKPEYAHHPNINVFFNSLAENAVVPGVSAILTGMGRDGADGMLNMRQRGWHTIAQDEKTSAVFGMPKTAIRRQAAVEVLPIDRIAGSIQAQLSRIINR